MNLIKICPYCGSSLIQKKKKFPKAGKYTRVFGYYYTCLKCNQNFTTPKQRERKHPV